MHFSQPSNGAGTTHWEMDWYALYTRHQHEKNIARSLASRGFEVFLPLYEETRQWSDRRKRLTLPLFSCYVFVRARPDHRVDVLTTPGVHGFVSFDNHPAPIPPSEIENLHRVIERTRIEPHPFLRCGDTVRVRYGPFTGIEGILARKKGQTRLVLSVALLQKAAAIEIDAALIERLPRSRSLEKERSVEAHADRFSVAV